VTVPLTILMPVFNEQATVEAAIADALGAELPVASRQLVVDDDGSTTINRARAPGERRRSVSWMIAAW
jgi:glycosyltransferase involved in cell wall biosynthesis